MPDEDFECFMERRPTIICQPGINGAAYSFHLPVLPGSSEAVLHVLYFGRHISRSTDERIARLVAPETAHLVLALAEKWGFRGSYSKRHLGQIREREERLERRNAARPVTELLG